MTSFTSTASATSAASAALEDSADTEPMTITPSARNRAPGGRSSTDSAGAGSSFTALTRSIHELGLMRRRYGYYWAKLIGEVLAVVAWVVGFVLLGDSWWQLVSAAVLALLMTQLGFLGHDAAHRQIFKSGRWNDWVSLILSNLVVGISYGWWRSKHNRHHANPNKVGADPDISSGALAYTPEQLARRQSPVMAWLVAHQGWYFFPLLLLEGLSLHSEGVRRFFSRGPVEHRWLEMLFLTIRLGGLVALVFLVLSPGKGTVFLAVELGVFGLYLGAMFAPNHIGMPLVSPRLKLDFLRRQVLMSRNVRGGRLISIAMGGLNYQIEHHLFPSMARPYLRRAQPLVVAYCAAQGVPYTQTTLWQAYRSVIGYLNAVGLRGKDVFLCPMVAQRRAL